MSQLLKAPAADAVTVTAGGRVYPVREGAFLARDDMPEEVRAGFEQAVNVPEDAAAELAELGSEEAEQVNEPAQASAVASVDLGPLHAQVREAHEKADAAHARLGELEERVAGLEATQATAESENADEKTDGETADEAKDTDEKTDADKTADAGEKRQRGKTAKSK